MITELAKIKQICSGDITKIENYSEAINDYKFTWNLHHRLGANHSVKELKDNNMYLHRPPEELIFLPPKDIFAREGYLIKRGHQSTHAEARRCKDAEFEFDCYIERLSRRDKRDKIISSPVQFESWIASHLTYMKIKYRLDAEGISNMTGISKDWIEQIDF